MQILKKISDPHVVLNKAYGNFTINNISPALITFRLKTLSSQFKLIRYLIVLLNTIFLMIDIWKLKGRYKYIVIREFSNLPLLWLCFFAFPLRRKLFFNVNHNLSSLPYKFPWSITLLCQLGFQFILFDGLEVSKFFPRDCLKSFFFPQFPSNDFISKAKKISLKNNSPLITFVGDLRPEKGNLNKIADALKRLSLALNCKIVYGSKDGKLPKGIDFGIIRAVNTKVRSDYFKLLNKSSVVIIFAEKNSYFARHSGTIMDAIASGAIPLVPSLPIFISQINNPVPVGIEYRGLSDLKSSVIIALDNLSKFKKHRAEYFNFRKIVNIYLHQESN